MRTVHHSPIIKNLDRVGSTPAVSSIVKTSVKRAVSDGTNNTPTANPYARSSSLFDLAGRACVFDVMTLSLLVDFSDLSSVSCVC